MSMTTYFNLKICLKETLVTANKRKEKKRNKRLVKINVYVYDINTDYN